MPVRVSRGAVIQSPVEDETTPDRDPELRDPWRSLSPYPAIIAWPARQLESPNVTFSGRAEQREVPAAAS